MSNKMLIDAAHPEETRVVLTRGNKVEEFDFESASRRPLRGNIYLAKVTRVEPSLQAAFIEYGGNRHGFLAFNEIHPDYYQVPHADRQALIEEEQREQEEARRAEEEMDAKPRRRRNTRKSKRSEERTDEAATSDDAASDDDAAPSAEAAADESPSDRAGDDGSSDDEPTSSQALEVVDDGEEVSEPADETFDDDEDDDDDESNVEAMGDGDALEEVPVRKPRRAKQYKIQEVIKRRQILLVQVVKEERGNKGAALTTYLSLAGRYCVLMPNTARGGGISRKITNASDRKRLKTVAEDLDVPQGMGLIVRTAGASRTKTEVKRDYEYLLRLWENVRDLTLKSHAPTLVYEEGDLIKRSIRDLYTRDVDEILVEGEEGYREAKDFMRMLMPSHAKNVQPFRERQPLFAKHGVESQLDAMFDPQVRLKSGGYLVINQTEALVAIDVNSGKSTREHNIEDTATKTNLEAAEEVARQLRLRDLAGLIVIDFIDMDEKRNNRAVEKKMKDCLKTDRARIQVGHISAFGLLEMSRQRIRTGVVEGSSVICPHCAGSGMVRSDGSSALHLLRAVDDHLTNDASHDVVVRTRTDIALYIFNQKRDHLAAIEERHGVNIRIEADESLEGTGFAIDRGERADPATRPKPVAAAPIQAGGPEIEDAVVEEVDEIEEEETPALRARETEAETDEDESGDRKRRGRRRRRRGGRSRDGDEAVASDEAGAETEAASSDEPEEKVATVNEDTDPADENGDADGRRRRRGRRGGRRNRKRDEDGVEEISAANDDARSADEKGYDEAVTTPSTDGNDMQPMGDVGSEIVGPDDGMSDVSIDDTVVDIETVEEIEAQGTAVDAGDAVPVLGDPDDPAPVPQEPSVDAPETATDDLGASNPVAEPEQPRKRRSGWWQRGIFGS